MPFDQNITYRVNVDDSNFQAKLTQMRASMDSTLGGAGAGMGMGMSSAMMYGMMGAMGGGGGGMGLGGGMADFGSQIRPVTYTPPAIAMQPHFGMYQVHQTLAQAGLASMGGPVGVGISGAMTNFSNGGVKGLFTGPNAVPENISMAEYIAMSARGFGDRMGDAASVGVLTAGSTAAGLIAGGIGSAIGAAPFTSGLMQAVGGLVGGVAGGMMVSAYTGQVTDMMADNRQMQSALASGSFRFFTGSGGEIDQLTGRGMSRRTRANVAQSIQGMEMSDLRYGMDEYKQILEGGMQMDLFSGTRDTDDFKNKFKGLVENLKTVTSTLHTSLKEGLEVVRGMRDMGVTDPTEVNRLVMGSEMRGRMSGRTGMEMMAIGQAGAEIFRGTGVSMERGFELNQMNATSVRSMLNAGTLSREMIAQAGGENSLAQQMTAANLGAFQTAQGRAAMMANFNPATGQMNPNMITNLAGGDMMSQVARAASMGPAALLTFQAHQEDLISKMSPQQMQMMGLSLDVGVARQLQQAAPGLKLEDAIRNAGQMRGLSKPMIEAEIGMMHQDAEKLKADQEQAVDTMRTQAGMEDIRNRFNIGKQISNVFRRNLVAPIANGLTNISTAIGEDVENVGLRLMGASVTDPSMASKDLVDRGEQLIRSSGAASGAVDVGGSFYQRMVGGQTGAALITQFEKAKDMTINGVKARQFANLEEAQKAGEADHVQYNVAKGSDGKYIGVTDADLKKMADSSRGLQATEADKEDAARTSLDDKVGVKLAGLGKNADIGAAIGVMFGGKVSFSDMQNLSDKEFTAKYKKSKGSYTAMAEKYFKTYGGFTPEAVSQLKDAQNTSRSTDALAQARSVNASTAGAAANNLLQDLEQEVVGTHGGGIVSDSEGKSEGIVGVLRSNKGALAVLYDNSLSSDEKKARIAKMTGFSGGLDEIIGKVEKEKGTSSGKQRTAMAQDLSAYTARANEAAQAATGSTGVVGSKTIGDLSQETVKILETQSSQLLDNYKQLIALQEKLNIIQKGGR